MVFMLRVIIPVWGVAPRKRGSGSQYAGNESYSVPAFAGITAHSVAAAGRARFCEHQQAVTLECPRWFPTTPRTGFSF